MNAPVDMADETDQGVVRRFHNWVKKNQKIGVNGKDNLCPYVPPSLLRTYWDTETVKEVLDSFDFHEDVNTIIEGFLGIFSTLVYLDHARAISRFLRENRGDNRLPVRSSESSNDWLNQFEIFLTQQWMFFPLEFSKKLMHKRELDSQQILPITYGESLRGHTYAGDGSSIRKVEIHPECNTMTETVCPSAIL